MAQGGHIQTERHWDDFGEGIGLTDSRSLRGGSIRIHQLFPMEY